MAVHWSLVRQRAHYPSNVLAGGAWASLLPTLPGRCGRLSAELKRLSATRRALAMYQQGPTGRHPGLKLWARVAKLRPAAPEGPPALKAHQVLKMRLATPRRDEARLGVRIAVTGATGNVGTSVLAALAGDPAVTSIIGIARRRPAVVLPKVEWRAADVVRHDLSPLFQGADAVVHLTWIVQPNHRKGELRAVNVGGTRRVQEAVAAAGVPILVHASAFAAYAGGAGDVPVDESWPTGGIPGSWYSHQKAEVERALDDFAEHHPQVRIVRFRSALVLKREAGAQAHRLYGGPLLPRALLRPGRIPVVPDVPGVRIQAVHSDDVGDAYRRAVVSDVHGTFNLAAEPVLTSASVAAAVSSRRVPVPARVMRSAVKASWLLRLQPTSPDWLDLMIQPPLLDTTKARVELGWTPTYSATEAMCEFLAGIADGAGGSTPPLAPLPAVRPSFRR